MELRPLPITRVATALGMEALPITAAITVAEDEAWPPVWAAAILVVGGLVFAPLAVRGYRMGVTCSHQHVTVRGLFRTRHVPVASILEVTDFPALVWQTHAGRKRWTPIVVFMQGAGGLRPIRDHHEACTRKLERWVRDQQANARRRERKNRDGESGARRREPPHP